MVSVGGDWPEKNKNIFVVSSTNAESNPVLCELAKDHNIRLIYWNDCLIRSDAVAEIPLSKIMEEIEEDEFLHNFVTYNGVDCWSMIKPYVELVVRKHLEIYLANVSRFLKLHNRCQIHMVVTAYELPLAEAVFQQCEASFYSAYSFSPWRYCRFLAWNAFNVSVLSWQGAASFICIHRSYQGLSSRYLPAISFRHADSRSRLHLLQAAEEGLREASQVAGKAGVENLLRLWNIWPLPIR